MRFLVKNNLSLIIILLGSLSWSLALVKSGLCWDAKCASGIGFWGPNGHDGIWHLALINHFAKGDYQMPVFSGEPLKNYHLGFDYLLAQLHNLTTIPSQTLYFQIIPPVLAVVIGWLTYKLVVLWRGSKTQALWATFFVYFGTSWGWLITLVRDGHIAGESIFWSQQAISTLVNPPYALSLIFLLLGLIGIVQYEKKKDCRYLFLSLITLGVVVEIKVYAGILAIAGLGAAALFGLLKQRSFVYSILAFALSVLAFSIFTLFSQVSTNLLVFQPFWFLETMMALSDRVGWQRFYDGMVAYKIGGVWFKLVPAYLIAFAVFWFGNLGTRVVKEFLVLRWIKKPSSITPPDVVMATIIVAGAIVPMFFLQKGTPWNTIQFFYYSLFFSSILAGVVFGEFMEGKMITKYFDEKLRRNIIAAVFVLLTIPTSASTLKDHYLPKRPPARISLQELEALSFLNKQPNGTVLTYPFDQKAAEKAQNNPPRPLYLYESTAYVSAFSAKQVYLEDQVNLDITDYNWRERREKVLSWLDTLDHNQAYQFLRANNIKYVYWLKGQRAKLGETQLGITQIFENKEVDIYLVN